MAQPRTRRLLIAAMRGARKPEVIGKLIVKVCVRCILLLSYLFPLTQGQCSGVEGSNLQMIVAGGTPMYTRLYHGLSMFSNNNNGSLFFYTLREQVIITGRSPQKRDSTCARTYQCLLAEEVTDFDIDGVLLVVGPTFHARSDIRNLIRSIPGFDGWTTAGKVAIVVNMLYVSGPSTLINSVLMLSNRHVTESDSIAHGDHPATLRARISYYFSEEGGWLPEK